MTTFPVPETLRVLSASGVAGTGRVKRLRRMVLASNVVLVRLPETATTLCLQVSSREKTEPRNDGKNP